MDARPTQAITPTVEERGFTLVEEDDVAFSLSLCREIYRLYGTYLNGELSGSDPVRHGLLLSMEMLAVMQNKVTAGMPAMRIQVAAAQTSEMIATLFGHVVPVRRSTSAWPGRDRACKRHVRASLPSTSGSEAESLSGTAPGHRKELTQQGDVAPASQPPAPPNPEASPEAIGILQRICMPGVSGRDLPSLIVRILAVVAGCCLAAGLIDLPFAIVALFPNLWIPLTLGFVGVGFVCKRYLRVGSRALRAIRLG